MLKNTLVLNQVSLLPFPSDIAPNCCFQVVFCTQVLLNQPGNNTWCNWIQFYIQAYSVYNVLYIWSYCINKTRFLSFFLFFQLGAINYDMSYKYKKIMFAILSPGEILGFDNWCRSGWGTLSTYCTLAGHCWALMLYALLSSFPCTTDTSNGRSITNTVTLRNSVK